MSNSSHVEELEINFVAFVNSSRNVTFVLQKEYKHDHHFENWYEEKVKEMREDPLCKFFHKIRNRIIKEGINGIFCNTKINRLNSGKDFPDQPKNSSVTITNKGIYYKIEKGTPQEDLIPAKTTGDVITQVFIQNSPSIHMGRKLKKNDLITISRVYYAYLCSLIEDWVEHKMTVKK